MKFAKISIGIIIGIAIFLSLLSPVYDKTHGYRLMPASQKHLVNAVYFSTFSEPIIVNYGIFRARKWQSNTNLVIMIKTSKSATLKTAHLISIDSNLEQGSVIDFLKDEPEIKRSGDTSSVLFEIKRNNLTIQHNDQIILIKYEYCDQNQCAQFEHSQEIKYTYNEHFHFQRLTSLIYAN